MAKLSKSTLARARQAAANLYKPISGLAFAAALIMPTMAAAAIPPSIQSVTEFCAAELIIPAETGTPFPGPFDPDLIPFLPEIMDACGPDDPTSSVTVLASAQSAKSMIGIAAICHRIATHPVGIAVTLGTHEEASKYSEVKLEPILSASPALARCVMTGHGKDGSKVMRKRFRGGFLQFASATNPKNLQMLSFGLTINEEISGWPRNAGERGDPHANIRARGKAFGVKFKEINLSTPAKSGTCKQTELTLAGTQHHLFWQCVHCADWYHLRFEHLERYQGRAVAIAPCCGAVTEHKDKNHMAKTARFIPLYPSDNPANPVPLAKAADGKTIDWVIRNTDIDAAHARPLEGRDKSFKYWQAMVPLPNQNWISILDEYDAAQGDPEKLAAFSQQTLGEAFELATERPKWKTLLANKGGAPRARTAPITRGIIPSWAGFVTMSADLQGNRGEWAAYAHGPGRIMACIDHGIIPIAPLQDEFWIELRRIFATPWPSTHMRPQIAARYGVDTGGHNSQEAYRFIRSNPDVHGIQGMKGIRARFGPPFQIKAAGRLKLQSGRIDETRIDLLQINTHLYKKQFYIALNNAIQSHNDDELTMGRNVFFHPETDEEFFKQITAEFLYEDRKKDIEQWRKVQDSQANEQLDLGVYAMALADLAQISRMSREDWTRHFTEQAIDPKTLNIGPLEALMISGEITPERLPRHGDDVAIDKNAQSETSNPETLKQLQNKPKPNWLTQGINK